MKVIRLVVASFLVIGLTGLAAPAHAVQPSATNKQKAVAKIVYLAFEESLAEDPNSFEDICTLYVINPKRVLNLFMGEKEIKDATRMLGATTKDFRAGINIALKKVCA